MRKAVTQPHPRRNYRAAAILLLSALTLLPGCQRGHRSREAAYVSAPQAFLRDQLAAVFNKTATVKNGERVDVLEREKHFARVRTATGAEGWIELRYLITQQVFDQIQSLTQASKNAPVQAPGVLRNETNLHISPGRDTEHLYQLASAAKVSILKRATAERTGVAVAASRAGSKTAAKAAGPAREDWLLVRDSDQRVGWVLSRMVDVDVPLDIAQYAEGQRFVAFFVLNTVKDEDKPVPQYLCLLTEPHDGLDYDFDQVRVYTWNLRKHRYETAYRERGLDGVLPVTVTNENYEKEGPLPTFVLRTKGDGGNFVERKYKLNTPMVRRVFAPGEQPVHAASPQRHRRK